MRNDKQYVVNGLKMHDKIDNESKTRFLYG